MADLKGKVAWVTGAGSGIGEAAALALAAAGAAVVLTGRRKEPLEDVARRIKAAGGKALVKAGDLIKPATAQKTAAAIQEKFGRLDILVNNAGLNIQKRRWADLDYEGLDTVIQCNLSSAYYCVIASLPMMRAQKDGVMIHTASWAGRFVGPLAGTAYTAAKHAVVAMSHTLNLEECVNGIRSTALCPAEVATPILEKRPSPVSKADRAKMLQPGDLGDLILYVVTRPAHVCLNEVVISPTWNRTYVAVMKSPEN